MAFFPVRTFWIRVRNFLYAKYVMCEQKMIHTIPSTRHPCVNEYFMWYKLRSVKKKDTRQTYACFSTFLMRTAHFVHSTCTQVHGVHIHTLNTPKKSVFANKHTASSKWIAWFLHTRSEDKRKIKTRKRTAREREREKKMLMTFN